MSEARAANSNVLVDGDDLVVSRSEERIFTENIPPGIRMHGAGQSSPTGMGLCYDSSSSRAIC